MRMLCAKIGCQYIERIEGSHEIDLSVISYLAKGDRSNKKRLEYSIITAIFIRGYLKMAKTKPFTITKVHCFLNEYLNYKTTKFVICKRRILAVHRDTKKMHLLYQFLPFQTGNKYFTTTF